MALSAILSSSSNYIAYSILYFFFALSSIKTSPFSFSICKISAKTPNFLQDLRKSPFFGAIFTGRTSCFLLTNLFLTLKKGASGSRRIYAKKRHAGNAPLFTNYNKENDGQHGVPLEEHKKGSRYSAPALLTRRPFIFCRYAFFKKSAYALPAQPSTLISLCLTIS